MQFLKKFFFNFLLIASIVNNCHAVTINDLTNKDWILKSLNGLEISLTSYIGKKPRIKFFDNLSFTAWAGCNEISGSYHFREPDALDFDQNMIMTKMACDTPQNIEDELISALQQVRKITLTDNLMQLLNDQDKALIEYISLQ